MRKRRMLFQESAYKIASYRSSHPEVFLGKGVLKICSKFTREHPCQSVTSKKLQINVIAGWLLLTVPLSGIILQFIIQFSTTKSCF